MNKLKSRYVFTAFVLILMITGVYFVYTKSSTNKTESKTVNVSFGKEFKLRDKDVAVFDGLDTTLSIESFTNSPCPKSSQCFWSGQGVNYELKINSLTYNTDQNTPYKIAVKRSDYKTYAIFEVQKR